MEVLDGETSAAARFGLDRDDGCGGPGRDPLPHLGGAGVRQLARRLGVICQFVAYGRVETGDTDAEEGARLEPARRSLTVAEVLGRPPADRQRPRGLIAGAAVMRTWARSWRGRSGPGAMTTGLGAGPPGCRGLEPSGALVLGLDPAGGLRALEGGLLPAGWVGPKQGTPLPALFLVEDDGLPIASRVVRRRRRRSRRRFFASGVAGVGCCPVPLLA